MSTVPATPLLDAPADGPMFDAAALEAPLAAVISEIVAAKRELARIRGDRERAVQLLADADGSLLRANRRVDNAAKNLDAYLAARVEGPIP